MPSPLDVSAHGGDVFQVSSPLRALLWGASPSEDSAPCCRLRFVLLPSSPHFSVFGRAASEEQRGNYVGAPDLATRVFHVLPEG